MFVPKQNLSYLVSEWNKNWQTNKNPFNFKSHKTSLKSKGRQKYLGLDFIVYFFVYGSQCSLAY